MSDVPALRPIEPHLRGEDPPDDALLVLRGGPLTVEKLLEHALREQRRFSYRGAPMPSVSIEDLTEEEVAEFWAAINE